MSNSERIRLIRVDNKEYLYFFVKGSQPTIIPHEGKNTSTIKQNIKLSQLSDKTTNEPRNEEKSNNKPNILSDAISNARKMNPKLGFKR